MGRHTGGTLLDGPAPDPAPPIARMSIADKVRFVLRGIGQTLVTGGLVVLLFVFYEVYVTNWFSSAAQAQAHKEIIQEFQRGDDPTVQLPDGSYPKLPLGKGVANLYLPRLGRDYERTIVEGTSFDELAKGPGHYPGTALPGQVGNFAVAGHRVGKGEPFLNLDQLRAGDAVIVETESHWLVYRVKGLDHGLTGKDDVDGIPGREIVSPSDSGPLYAVPEHPGARPTEKLMTMTTCHPKFTAAQRMIVYSVLAKTYDKASGTAPMPATVKALYNAIS